MKYFKFLFFKLIDKINKIDKLGRKQGLWFGFWWNKKIAWKEYCLNGNSVNYFIRFEHQFDNVFYEDIFIYEIF